MKATEPLQPVPASPQSRRSVLSLLGVLLVFVAALAALLFLPAGRVDWLQGWLFLLAYAAFGGFYGAWTLRHDPAQLDERMQIGANTKGWDKVLLITYTLLLLGTLVLSSLDAGRFRWAPVPLGLQLMGWFLCLLAGSLILWTSSTNTFLSRTVRIQDERGQRVITAGPYAFVRHPMYLGMIPFFVGIPLLLGSGWGLVPAGATGVLIVVRTALEDRMLHLELPGYPEYAQRVRYRLLPGIW